MTSKPRTSRLSGFYKLTVDERLDRVQAFGGLDNAEINALRGGDDERLRAASRMIENVAGLFHLPVGIAANFRVDGKDVLMPMVIEEASVVAASSNAARLMRSGDGIVTDATPPLMIGQIQLCDIPDLQAGEEALKAATGELVARANAGAPRLVKRGGGARRVDVRRFDDSAIGAMLIVHVIVDVCDAMGANLVNGMAESLASRCEELSGGRANLRILSNLADERLIHATGRIPIADLDSPRLKFDGADVAERIVRASVFAEVDPYRAATHNKGIMNGIDALLLATGQDWRAVEAGAHAFAARSGQYTAMSQWRVEGDELVGRLTVPMQVGIVGGVTKVHPTVGVLLKLLGARTATDIGRAAAAVGLAQNLAAIMALATEGIQRGHMSLHARNIAAAVGARDAEIDRVVKEMIKRHTITHDAAANIMANRGDEPLEQAPLSLHELKATRDKYWPKIEALLTELIPRDGPAGSFSDVFWYQFDTGGKRLRAVIPLIVFEAFGGDASRAVPIAAAMELLHNFSLIQHDALDRVRTRRGKDTAWVRFGIGPAISCGDGMQLAAIRCCTRLRGPTDTSQRVVELITERMLDVVRAQMEVMRLPRDELDDTVLAAIRDRTGGLFSLSVAASAILAGADRAIVRSLEEIGGHLGMIFQAQDELLGIVGGFSNYLRGAAIVDGVQGLLLRHCLANLADDEQQQLQGILNRSARDTNKADVHLAIGLLKKTSSLQFGADLIGEHQGAINRLSDQLPQTGLVRLCSGITDIFLAPLIARFDESKA